MGTSVTQKKPLLLVITSSFPKRAGDTESFFVFELCRRLAVSYHVHVLAPHAKGLLCEEDIDGVKVFRFRYCFEQWETLTYQGGILPNARKHPWRMALIPFFLFSEGLALIKAIRARRYAVVHAHWLIPQGFVAAMARLFVGTMPPLLCTCHGSDIFALRGLVAGMIKRLVLAKMDGVVGVSRALQQAIQSLGARPERTAAISMGVDLAARFVPPKQPRRRKQLLFVGRMVNGKGLSVLLEAMPTVLARHPGARLIIVGDGPEEGILKDQAARLGMNGSLSFLGAVPNDRLPAIYQASELFVLPSIVQEGFGLVLVEAMGCGCAVLATDFPSVHEIIREGETGLLVPPGDRMALAEKIIYLLDHDDLRRKLGETGRQYIRERYDWSVVTDRYRDMILKTSQP